MTQTRQWILDSIEKRGYVETCRAHSIYLVECHTDKPYNGESYVRECRKAMAKIRGGHKRDAFDVKTAVDSVDFHEVDLGKYDVKRATVNTWGSSTNQNKQVKLELHPRSEGFNLAELVDEFKREVAGHSPIMATTPNNQPTGKLLEMSIPDLHLGLLSWASETGVDYDLKLAKKVFLDAVDRMLDFGKTHGVDRILFVLGHDFFNSDTPENTTTHGTRQDEDTRWAKTFSEGWMVVRDAVEKCLSVAQTDLIIAPGNHDTTRSYFMGEVIRAWFSANTALTVDNSPRAYKAYQWGKCFLGHTHGHLCKPQNLPGIFATDYPDLWGKTVHRVVRVGHGHQHIVQEFPGISVEMVPSLGAPSAWTMQSGYRSVRAGHAYIWDREEGNLFMYKVRPRK